MQGNRCPNCENDLGEEVKSAVIAMLQDGDDGVIALVCPHCDEELTVSANIRTTVVRHEPILG